MERETTDIILMIIWFIGSFMSGVLTLIGMFMISTDEYIPKLKDKYLTGLLGLLFLTCLYMSYQYSITVFN